MVGRTGSWQTGRPTGGDPGHSPRYSTNGHTPAPSSLVLSSPLRASLYTRTPAAKRADEAQKSPVVSTAKALRPPSGSEPTTGLPLLPGAFGLIGPTRFLDGRGSEAERPVLPVLADARRRGNEEGAMPPEPPRSVAAGNARPARRTARCRLTLSKVASPSDLPPRLALKTNDRSALADRDGRS
ncbi:hypothetical protein KM043_006092 [Ampulex compressa]|nr:hypothetical protein KM043_006092 [Ampulex compressa]